MMDEENACVIGFNCGVEKIEMTFNVFHNLSNFESLHLMTS